MEENTTPQTEKDLFKNALRFGLIVGVIGIAITMILYVIDYALLVDWKVGLLSLAIYIGLVIYFGISFRKEIGGFLSFGNAFLHGFIILVTGGIIGTLFSIVLYNVIDKELGQKMTEVIIGNAEAMMQKFGAPESSIDEAIEKMKIDTPKGFTVLGLLKQFGWTTLISAVLCLITGAVVKRNQPVEM